MRQFIGIAHITDPAHVQMLARVSHEAKNPLDLCVSVMASHRVMTGKETRWRNAFPAQDAVATMMKRKNVLYVLNYVDSDNYATAKDYIAILEKCAGRAYGIHFNRTSLPTIEDLSTMISYLTDRGKEPPKIILRIDVDAMHNEECAIPRKFDTPQSVATLMKDYHDHGCADYILLHKNMDTKCAEVLPLYMSAIRERIPKIGIIAAGRLCRETLPFLWPIVREFPDISIIAQSNLRFSGCMYDPLEKRYATAYLRGAIRLFRMTQNLIDEPL